MKRLIGISAIVFLFSMCSTELDLLDDWKETCVVYGLLDQDQPKQYIRIQKAFLGPDNAYNMAQVYDSINYISTIDVKMEQVNRTSGQVAFVYVLTPDTFYNKQDGDFYSPTQVIYSFDTPLNFETANFDYRLVITRGANTVHATTHLVESFDIVSQPTPNISFIKFNSSTVVEVKWEGAPSARLYQLAMYFTYFETDIGGNTTFKATPPWVIGEVETTTNTANQTQSIKFDPDGFYRFIAQQVPADNNVASRESQSVEFVVFACGEQLNEYMEINGPSTGIAQERPFYSNIMVTNADGTEETGIGVFSGRTRSVKGNLLLTPQSLDSLSYGRFTCPLKFEDRNGIVVGCQ
ncbi:MAG TPA: hypothetical protein VK826_03770 [Bacteroidia bacterium]|nr:hypothetical protein [Bacteroidia bacterium]